MKLWRWHLLGLLFFLTLSDSSMASERLMVELAENGGIAHSATLQSIRKLPGVIEVARFDDFPSDYFKRLFRVEVEEYRKNELKTQLESLPEVAKVEGSFPIELHSEPPSGEVPTVGAVHFDSQWGLYNRGQKVVHDIDDIRTEVITGKPGVDVDWFSIRENLDAQISRDLLVAVIDSGLDLEHPAIQKTLFRNWVECGPGGRLPFKPTEDKDHNGYIGDCLGWNFTSDRPEGDFRTMDGLGHGTHVGGIIALDSDNPHGLRSISSRIKLLPVKVIRDPQRGASTGSSSTVGSITDRVAKGILYAVKMKVDVINLSLGWPRSLNTRYLHEAIRAALDQNIIVVSAAGNNHHDDPGFPCAISGVICVGSIDIDGQLSRFSNFGSLVDLLAPGDSILSLYPRKLTPTRSSVIGYEFKNGTSQAAPFVSAAAAVLRGLYPDSPPSQLIARLLEATQPRPEGHYPIQNGVLQLSRAISLSLGVSLQPNFRAVQEVEFSHLTKRFQASLPILNQGVAPKWVEVEIEFPPGLSLDQKRFRFLRTRQDLTIPLTGHILDESMDSHFSFQVKILHSTTKSRIPRVYEAQADLVRILDATERAEQAHAWIGASIKGVRTPVIYSGQSVQTVIHRFRDRGKPEYFFQEPMSKSDTTDSGLAVTLVRPVGKTYITAERQILLPRAQTLLRVERLDFNYDGSEDYLLISIATPPSSNENSKVESHLQFSFYTSNLTPLYGEHSHWIYHPDSAPIDPQRLSFLAWNPPPEWGDTLGRFPRIAIPTFHSQGSTPRADRDPSYWAETPPALDAHLYYLLPTFLPLKDSSPVALQTRVIDRFQMRNRVQRLLSLPHGVRTYVVGLLPQTKEQFRRGFAEAILSIGQGYLRSQYTFSVSLDPSSKLFELTALETGHLDFSALTPHPVTVLDPVSGDSIFPYGVDYLGFYSHSRLVQSRLQDLQTRTENLVLSNPHDPLFGYIHGFELPGREQIRFLQSRYHLILWRTYENEKPQIFQRPIHRYSFLTGTVFNELFFPVLAENSLRQLSPSIFVDATQIHGSQLAVFTLDKGELRARAFHSIQIPKGCRTLNPSRISENDLDHFTFVCQDENGPRFEFIPMKAPD